MSIDNSSIYMNSMTDLLDKIETRLGMSLVLLPEKLAKKSWPAIIERDYDD